MFVAARPAYCWLVVVALFAPAVAGCGGKPKYPVTGKVTLPDGSPFVGAVVEFAAKEGANSSAAVVGPDGMYSASTDGDGDGAPPGAYRVRLIAPDEDDSGNADDDDPGGRRRKKSPLPRKYLSFDNSGLEFTVTDSGENRFDIPIAKQ